MDSTLQVLARADSYDLTNLATVKDRLGISTTGDDADLSRLVISRSARAARWCRRVFASEAVRETFQRRAGHCTYQGEAAPLLLERFPIASITSVIEDGIGLTADAYISEHDTGMLWRLDGCGLRQHWCAAQIVVTYVGGYLLPDQDPMVDGIDPLPADVQEAVVEMIGTAYQERRRDQRLKSIDTVGVDRVEYWVGPVPGGDDDTDIPNALRPYRLELV